ncbi:MAG: hypothetical protein AAF721_40980 [Myxococcota bacterium]
MLLLSTLLLAVAPATTGSPEAASPELELTWSAPQPCPDAQSVQDRVVQLLRRPLADAGELGTLTVNGRASAEGDGWSLALTIGTDAGARTRTLTGPSCDTLAETVALLTAISLDPGVDPSAPLPPTPPREPEAPPPKDAPPERAPTKPEATTPTEVVPPPDPRHRAAIFVGGSGAVGVTPLVAPGVTAAAALMWPHARLQLRFDHWFARTVDAPDGADAAASISMTTGGIRGCAVPTVGIADFPVCAGVLGGQMRGRGQRLASRVDARLPFVGFDIGPAVGIAPKAMRGIVAFVLAVDIVVPVLRPGFIVDDLGLVSRIFPVVGRATLGIEIRLPKIARYGLEHSE